MPFHPDLASAHAHTMRNRASIAQSEQCGCGFCQSIFPPEAITDWWDAPAGTPDAQANALGETAVCPFCGLDAVIGSASGFPIAKNFLIQLKNYFF